MVGYRCTTRRPNTHGTEVRELLYPWHPWSGQFVHVHEALAKGTAIFRCSLSGASSDRLVEVPAWMFDRSVSGYWRSLPVPPSDSPACILWQNCWKKLAPHHNAWRWAQHWSLTKRVGEMSMPRQSMTYQFDLFSAPHRGKTAATPQWQELPEETRQALTALIVRLFVDHASDASASQQKEVGHDA